MLKWFSRWSDMRSERHDFQFGELVSFNSEYDCLHLVLPVQPPKPRRDRASRTLASGHGPKTG
jgi:hypothetical protein